jgi:hypothetical protein
MSKKNSEIHWEIILCEDDGTWSSLYILSRNKDEIHKLVLGDLRFRKVIHYFFIGPNDGWNWPDEDFSESINLITGQHTCQSN